MWLLARVVTILVSATALAVVFALTNSVFGPSEGGFTFSELFLLNMRTCLVLFTAVGLIVFMVDRKLKKLEPIKVWARSGYQLVISTLFAIGFLYLINDSGYSLFVIILLAVALSGIHRMVLVVSEKIMLKEEPIITGIIE
ncbi:hypothetical protein [Alkalihalobacillus pseudalcaliphilus]|uniref:hypothetical protein n=1 Tax=Alkalihalobacillus pseudalcaliphilus TaxID=79884 RepID=UPI00064E09D5|nr:hypothetical protein [Alkalihalobacillus pseudalcaliphilus]KMK76838.1 hypothetical protein AB990_08035 [Alkalihalobacillus pseudalcaliphilus]